MKRNVILIGLCSCLFLILAFGGGCSSEDTTAKGLSETTNQAEKKLAPGAAVTANAQNNPASIGDEEKMPPDRVNQGDIIQDKNKMPANVYEGFVLEADTDKPIEGAIVLAVWEKVEANVAGSNEVVVAAHETLTNEYGRFHFSPPDIEIENIELSFHVFKGEYEQFEAYWQTVAEDSKVTIESAVPVIRLKHLDIAQRHERLLVLPYVDESLMPLYMAEYNKEIDSKYQKWSPLSKEMDQGLGELAK